MSMTTGSVLPPPPRVAVPVLHAPTVIGEAIVLRDDSPECRYGYRGWRDPYDADGVLVVDVITEDEWHRAMLLGSPPSKALRWPAHAAWVA